MVHYGINRIDLSISIWFALQAWSKSVCFARMVDNACTTEDSHFEETM